MTRDRRQTDSEDGDRARGLHDKGQHGRDDKGEKQGLPGSLHHLPEPGLLGERRRGLPEQHQAEDDQRPSQERPGDGPVPRQPLGGHHRAGKAR